MTPQSWHGKLKITKTRRDQAAGGAILSPNNFLGTEPKVLKFAALFSVPRGL